jgi:major histocompatibility complex class I
MLGFCLPELGLKVFINISHLSNRKTLEPGVVVHTFNPSTREAEAGRFLSSRPAWSTE